MLIKKDMEFRDLMESCWSGAIDTLKTVEENNKEEELMELLEEIFVEYIPSLTQINDMLWFESEWLFEQLGLIEEEEEEEC